MDFWSFAKEIGVPLLGAGSGVIGAAFKTKSKIKSLEEAVRDHDEEFEKKLENLKKAWRLELDSLKDDYKEEQKEIKMFLESLEADFEAFERESRSSFAKDEEFNKFVDEVNRQWQSVHRTLGRVEGLLEK